MKAASFFFFSLGLWGFRFFFFVSSSEVLHIILQHLTISSYHIPFLLLYSTFLCCLYLGIIIKPPFDLSSILCIVYKLSIRLLLLLGGGFFLLLLFYSFSLLFAFFFYVVRCWARATFFYFDHCICASHLLLTWGFWRSFFFFFFTLLFVFVLFLKRFCFGEILKIGGVSIEYIHYSS